MPDLRTIRYVQEKLCTWYREYGRDLPWRRTRDPYAILVSEIMLQQTQVDRVIPKYHTFLKTFPTFRELAKASRAKVIHLWVGLGYNSRAVRLHELATTVAECHKGRLPRELKQLEALPGIGPYTARAVRSFAYHEQETVQDTNIRRVLARLYFGKNPSAVAKRILEHTMVKTELPGKSSMWYHHSWTLARLSVHLQLQNVRNALYAAFVQLIRPYGKRGYKAYKGVLLPMRNRVLKDRIVTGEVKLLLCCVRKNQDALST